MPKNQTATRTPNSAVSSAAKPKQTLRTARSGETYVLESDQWRIGGRLIIPWSVLKKEGLTERTAPELVDAFRKVMAELVGEVSASYARGVFDQVVSLLRHCQGEVTIDGFEAWRATLRQRYKKETHQSYLKDCRAGLNAWSDGNYTGLEKGLVDHINRIRVGSRQFSNAVREQCPVRGPFTQDEEVALIRWLHQAYADGTLTLQAYAMMLTELEFGCRPVELAALRAGDVMEGEADQCYLLAIPNAKGGRNYRASFRTLELSADLYALLKRVIFEGQAAVAGEWKQPVSPRLSKQLPLFVGKRLRAAGSNEAFEHRISRAPETFDISCIDQLVWTFGKCPVTTERLNGELMPLSIYRFRRTVATRLAGAGADDSTIATILGHASTHTVKVYTAHTYEDQEACDAIMAEAWMPVLKMAEERLLDVPIPGQAKVHITRDASVGNCSQLCGSGTLNCYLCPKFKPFIDAPHDQALAQVESLRQSRIDHGLSGPEVDSLDLPIAAIKATIRLCEEHQQRISAHG